MAWLQISFVHLAVLTFCRWSGSGIFHPRRRETHGHGTELRCGTSSYKKLLALRKKYCADFSFDFSQGFVYQICVGWDGLRPVFFISFFTPSFLRIRMSRVDEYLVLLLWVDGAVNCTVLMGFGERAVHCREKAFHCREKTFYCRKGPSIVGKRPSMVGKGPSIVGKGRLL